MPSRQLHQIVAATFATADGGLQAAAAVTGVIPEKIISMAVICVQDDGRASFDQTRQWRAGPTAVVTEAIASIGGPAARLAGPAMANPGGRGGGLGGFHRHRLAKLRQALTAHTSAIVLDVVVDTAGIAGDLLRTLQPSQILTVPARAPATCSLDAPPRIIRRATTIATSSSGTA